jgi:Fibronectin type III domain
MSHRSALKGFTTGRGWRTLALAAGLIGFLMALCAPAAQATAPTSAATGLAATSGIAVQLAWTAPEESVDHYIVYRGTSTDAMSVLAGATRVVETTYLDRDVTAGTTYHYQVRAADSDGNEGPASDPAQATALYSTALRVAASPQSVVSGGAVTLTATLTVPGTDGALPLPDETVQVLGWRVTDPEAWVSLGTATPGGEPGSYVYVVKPTVQTYYEFTFAGSGLNAASLGSVAVLTRLKLLGAPVSPSRVHAGHAFTVVGYAQPRLTRGEKMIRVLGYRRAKGKWILKKTWWTVNFNYHAYTRYRVSVKLPLRGAWRLCAAYSSTEMPAPFLPAVSGFSYLSATPK